MEHILSSEEENFFSLKQYISHSSKSSIMKVSISVRDGTNIFQNLFWIYILKNWKILITTTMFITSIFIIYFYFLKVMKYL